MKLTIEQIKELIKELTQNPRTESLHRSIERIDLPDGRKAEVQIIITTNQDDFIGYNL